MLKGLPASGKSTYAKQLIASEPNRWKRVNRDSLRLMFAEEFNDRNEKFILRIRDTIIKQALSEGYDVVVDDLNVSQKHYDRISSIAGKNVDIEIDDRFMEVPLDELLRRNANREAKVPERVIRDLYEKHVSMTVSKQERSNMFKNEAEKRRYIDYDPTLQNAVIFDIDGTLALMNGRSPFDMSAVASDLVNEPVARLAKEYMERPDVKVFIVTGRDGEGHELTKQWLATYGLDQYDEFWGRPAGDMRKDAIIKEEIYKEHVEGKYNVLAVFDDRNQTVEKWRELGLLCLQVAPGNF